MFPDRWFWWLQTHKEKKCLISMGKRHEHFVDSFWSVIIRFALNCTPIQNSNKMLMTSWPSNPPMSIQWCFINWNSACSYLFQGGSSFMTHNTGHKVPALELYTWTPSVCHISVKLYLWDKKSFISSKLPTVNVPYMVFLGQIMTIFRIGNKQWIWKKQRIDNQIKLSS